MTISYPAFFALWYGGAGVGLVGICLGQSVTPWEGQGWVIVSRLVNHPSGVRVRSDKGWEVGRCLTKLVDYHSLGEVGIDRCLTRLVNHPLGRCVTGLFNHPSGIGVRYHKGWGVGRCLTSLISHHSLGEVGVDRCLTRLVNYPTGGQVSLLGCSNTP